MNDIEHVLVESVIPGRFALNHAKGHDIHNWHLLECFYNRFWHEGRVKFGEAQGGYYFEGSEDHRIIPLQAGMIVRIPERYNTED